MELKHWALANCVWKFQKADRTRVVATTEEVHQAVVLAALEVVVDSVGAAVRAVAVVDSVVMTAVDSEAIQVVAIVKMAVVVLAAEIRVVTISVHLATVAVVVVVVVVDSILVHAKVAVVLVAIAAVAAAAVLAAETPVGRADVSVHGHRDLASKFDSLIFPYNFFTRMNFMFS